MTMSPQRTMTEDLEETDLVKETERMGSEFERNRKKQYYTN